MDGSHPNRQHIATAQVIEERTLARLEATEHRHVNAILCAKLFLARDDQRLEAAQPQVCRHALHSFEDIIRVAHARCPLCPAVSG
jgi:predicted Zn-ribbon and HTH transcriptional regulator